MWGNLCVNDVQFTLRSKLLLKLGNETSIHLDIEAKYVGQDGISKSIITPRVMKKSSFVVLLLSSMLAISNILGIGHTFAQSAGWTRTKIDRYFSVTNVYFIDSLTGYVGGFSTDRPYPRKPYGYLKLFRTSDAGETWKEISPVIDTNFISYENGTEISTPTRSVIYLSPGNLCSFDSGDTWVQRQYKFTTFDHVHMFSASSGYGLSTNNIDIYKTEDSAKSFPIKRSDGIFEAYSGTSPFGEVWLDSLTGISPGGSVGDTSAGVGFVKTVDGGVHWSYHFQPFPDTTHYDYSTTGPLVSEPGTKRIWLYHSYITNGFKQSVTLPNSYYFSTDAGETWTGSKTFLGRIAAMGAAGGAVWSAISNGDTLTSLHPASFLAMSTDGVNWKIDSVSAKGLLLSALCFTDASHGWAVGNDTVTGTGFHDSTTGYVMRYVGPPLSSVRINAVVPQQHVDLTPNPVSSVLHFDVAGSLPIQRTEAIDVLGSSYACPLLSSRGTAGDVDVSALHSGVFLLRLWSAEGFTAKSFVKLN